MEQLQHHLPGMLLAYGAFTLGLMSPGPNILAVMGTAMGSGRRPGVALALGVAAGSFCWGALTLLGLTAVLAAYASVLSVIKAIGGAYLLWLAFKAFRSAASTHEIATINSAAGDRASACFLRGLTIQMTNPKAALTWIAVMSLGLQAGAPAWVGMAIVAGTSVLSVSGHLAYALVFSTAPMVAAYRRARRLIEVALGAFFCFAGLKLLTDRP